MKVNKKIIYIIAISLVVFLLQICLYGVQDFTDTETYLSAWDNILKGNVDEFRTPVYPIYLGSLKDIFKETNFIYAAAVGQYIVMLLSIPIFYKITFIFTSSDKLSFWLSAFYAACPTFIGYTTCLLTESLSISGSVFLLYGIIMLYTRCSWFWLFVNAMLFYLLLLLRPSFLYIIPVMICFCCICLIKKKKQTALFGLIISLSSICIIGCYAMEFKKQYGIYSISKVSTWNRWDIARQYGLLKPELIEDSALRSDIETSFELHGVMYEGAIETSLPKEEKAEKVYIFNKHKLKTINDALTISFLDNPIKYIPSIISRTARASVKPVFASYSGGWYNEIGKILSVNLGFIYCFLLFYAVIIVKWVRSNKVIPTMSSFVFMLIISNYVISIIGAQEEWNRLVVPSLPYILILFGQICNRLSVEKLKKPYLI